MIEQLRTFGVATGSFMRSLFARHGVVTEGFVWDYRPLIDRDTFEPHWRLHGTHVEGLNDPKLLNPLNFPRALYFYPGSHAGCFPSGTVVSGPLARGATLRWFEGELIEMVFASGEFLSATPNHPILTPDGWVSAALLNEGSDVIRCLNAQGIAGLIPDDYQVPTLIEQVVRACRETPSMVSASVPVAPEDFHGDGSGSQVSVVWTDSLLGSGSDSSLKEPQRELVFSGANPREVAFLSPSVLNAGFQGHLGAAPSSVSRGRKRLPFLQRRSLESQVHRFAFSTNRKPFFLQSESQNGATNPYAPTSLQATDPLLVQGDSGFNQPFVSSGSSGDSLPTQLRGDSLNVDAQDGGNLIDSLAGLVERDNLVSLRRVGFAGHVYNLQTDQGWYVANGVIVHNCRCMLKPDMRRTG